MINDIEPGDFCMLWRLRGFFVLEWTRRLADNFFCSFDVLTLDTYFLDQLFLGVEENIRHSAGLTKGCVTHRKTF